MNIRYPVVAGSFYESSPTSCKHHVEKLLAAAQVPDNLPGRLFGGLVPHAGWMFSGRVAALTLKALHKATGGLTSLVLFGAVHHYGAAERGEVYDSGVWRTPLGELAVDEELASAIVSAGGSCLRSNPAAHTREHSLEVQLPLIQMIAPGAKIVPIAVPPTELAVEIGRAVGEVLQERGTVVVVGSTDLTHHGGHFGSPFGEGAKGEQGTVRNDRRMLDLVESMAAEKVPAEAERQGNACGAGAIAATIAACRELGATRGVCLEYTNSYRVVRQLFPQETDDTTVGYASVVFA